MVSQSSLGRIECRAENSCSEFRELPRAKARLRVISKYDLSAEDVTKPSLPVIGLACLLRLRLESG